jgi:hypothetical protein
VHEDAEPAAECGARGLEQRRRGARGAPADDADVELRTEL